jgi:hypothetical protein
MAEADRNFSIWPMGYSYFIFTSSHIEELDPPPLAICKVENAGQWLKIIPFLWNSKVPQQGCVG